MKRYSVFRSPVSPAGPNHLLLTIHYEQAPIVRPDDREVFTGVDALDTASGPSNIDDQVLNPIKSGNLFVELTYQRKLGPFRPFVGLQGRYGEIGLTAYKYWEYGLMAGLGFQL